MLRPLESHFRFPQNNPPSFCCNVSKSKPLIAVYGLITFPSTPVVCVCVCARARAYVCVCVRARGRACLRGTGGAESTDTAPPQSPYCRSASSSLPSFPQAPSVPPASKLSAPSQSPHSPPQSAFSALSVRYFVLVDSGALNRHPSYLLAPFGPDARPFFVPLFLFSASCFAP